MEGVGSIEAFADRDDDDLPEPAEEPSDLRESTRSAGTSAAADAAAVRAAGDHVLLRPAPIMIPGQTVVELAVVHPASTGSTGQVIAPTVSTDSAAAVLNQSAPDQPPSPSTERMASRVCIFELKSNHCFTA